MHHNNDFERIDADFALSTLAISVLLHMLAPGTVPAETRRVCAKAWF
jgi:hypothetical protein